MNERIKLLAEQAGYLPDMFGIGHWDMPECKKFAESIVEECAAIALKSGNINNKSMQAKVKAERIYHKIKEHFGVD